MLSTRRTSLVAVLAVIAGLLLALPFAPRSHAADDSSCRPDGLYQTAKTDVPYCTVYDKDGREKMGADHPRRVIGYFTSWRDGKNGMPSYLVPNIPWDKVTHLNYAFAHIDKQNHISVGDDGPNNPSTGETWPGVKGAEMDPSLPYKGNFNLLTKYKKQHPNVKTLISVGGWAETGGILNPDGSRDATGGFYNLTTNSDGSVNTDGINTFADSVVKFLQTYGFNGVDIDYEYATSMNYAGNPDDFSVSNERRPYLMAGYVALMKTLREKLDAASAADKKYYMLSAATSASGWILRGAESYQVTQYLDYANLMTYDLHGSWNEYSGPNAALYDDGKDAELAFWQVYTTQQYDGQGYLNTDWAAHYFRGSMPAGRINIGVPFYTRGWTGVSGGDNGLWGTAPLPDQTKCPPGTGSSVNSKVPCGNGAVGIDNLWHDKTASGDEVASGSNPMWHAMNLSKGITPDYLSKWGLDPNKPENKLTGTYTPEYNDTLKSPWLWNDQKKVFLSTETEESLKAKTDYINAQGLGGVMIWELAGDYGWDAKANSGKGEYNMGQTLISDLYNNLKGASAYGATKTDTDEQQPKQLLNISADMTGFAVGDNNYPIAPKLHITNNTGTTIPSGTEFQFDYGTSAPASMKDISGNGLNVIKTGHSGPNVGGLKGNFDRVSFKTSSDLADGASVDVALTYYMPISGPTNWTVNLNGTTYGIAQDYVHGGSVVTPPSNGTTGASTGNNGGTTGDNGGTTGDNGGDSGGAGARCTAPAWDVKAAYNGGTVVSFAGHEWKARWWSEGDQPTGGGPGSKAGVWEDMGPCGGKKAAGH